ncbi:MAG: hypothetical protein H6728_15675 [Myxococcales bacterium]|nr:hypothetical protein [Myxococcales bacterium]
MVGATQKRDPNNSALHYLQGKIFYLRRQYAKSIATMKALVQKNKTICPRALRSWALLPQSQKYKLAFQAFYDATLVSDQAPHLPSYLQLFELEDRFPEESKRYETLWKESEKAFKVRNRQLLGHYTFLRAQRARSKEHLKEAYTLLTQAIQLDPNPRYASKEFAYLFSTRRYNQIAKSSNPWWLPMSKGSTDKRPSSTCVRFTTCANGSKENASHNA